MARWLLLAAVSGSLFLQIRPQPEPLPTDPYQRAEALVHRGLKGDEASFREALEALEKAEASLRQSREQGEYLCRQLRALCHDRLGETAERDALLPREMDRAVYAYCFGEERRAPPEAVLESVGRTMRKQPPPGDEWVKDPLLAHRMLLVWGVQTAGVLDGFDAMSEFFDIEPGDHVADIGCGVGPLSFLLAPRVAPAGSIDAVDVSASALDFIDFAKPRVPAGDRVHTVRSKPHDVNLPAASQDVCLMVALYHCLADDSQGQFDDPAYVKKNIEPLMRSVRRAMRQDGRLYLVDHLPKADTVVRHLEPLGFRLASRRELVNETGTYVLEFEKG